MEIRIAKQEQKGWFTNYVDTGGGKGGRQKIWRRQ